MALRKGPDLAEWQAEEKKKNLREEPRDAGMVDANTVVTGEGEARLEGVMFFCGTNKRNVYVANDSRLSIELPFFILDCPCGKQHTIRIENTEDK